MKLRQGTGRRWIYSQRGMMRKHCEMEFCVCSQNWVCGQFWDKTKYLL